MRKFILALLAACATTAAMAQDTYRYLTLATSSAEQSLELASLQKIVFDTAGQKVVVTTSEGVVEFPLPEMQKMFFSATPTAIEALPMQDSALRVTGSTLHANGKGLLHLYTAAGTLLHMAHIKGETRISLEHLPTGIYIINLGKQTIKYSKR